ncbi:MAG: VOC family protein [Candidatus Eremiobacteraeota bacterium]|nr:VOC family protein [Candidatus Eremiobacteraeota bacterium]
MGNPVVHFEVIGKDPQALQNFYKKAFDWKLDPPVPGAGAMNYAIAHPGDSGIDGGIGGAREGYDGHVTFYVGVPDIKAALGKIEALGGKRLMGPDVVPGGPTIALFTDPEDHVIGLVQV